MRKFLTLAISIAALQMPATAASVDDQARKLVDQGQLQPALDLELKAHQADPKNVEHLKALTFIYMQQGEPEKALLYAQEAVKLAPTDMAVHYNIAGVYQSMRRFDDAIKEYRVLQSLEKGSVSGSIGESLCLILSGKGLEAKTLLEKLSVTNPDNANVWSNLANLYAKKRDLDNAEKAARRAVSLKPDYDSYAILLKIQLNKHDLAAAVESAKQLMKVAPKNSESYDLAARTATALQAAEGVELAKSVVDASVANLPLDSALFSGMGRRFQLCGYHSAHRGSRTNRSAWFQLSERCYRQAVVAKPQDANFRLQLASILAGENNVSEAMNQTLEARRLDPANEDAKQAQAKLRVVQNDLARSLRNWLRAYSPLQ
jgi:tetratricopeptide (TPR) repeat protein